MFQAYRALISTTFILLGSPGPAPLALAATGAGFGVRAGLPFLAGILCGLAVAITGVTFGLAALFNAFPGIKLICQLIGAAYVCYIAYKVANAPVATAQSAASAPSFRDGFILNLINPKVYVVFVAIYAQFLLPYENTFWAHMITGITCFLVAVVVDYLWLGLGGSLKRVFSHPSWTRIIRLLFAFMMIVAVAMTFFI